MKKKKKMAIMESKLKQKSASSSSSAINGGVKVIDSGVEVVKNTESFDYWGFLDEIDAPMWVDLTLCDLIDDEMFHQCSSRQLISNGSVSIQEPPSPKLPPSISKSRGKSYKIKEWEQRKYKDPSNKQHQVNTSTKNSSVSTGSNNKAKPNIKTVKLKENEDSKACSSCESCPKFSNSDSSSLIRQDQSHESNSRSTLTSDHSEHQTSALLSSLRFNIRRSCSTRPAARVVHGGRRSESSSSKSSVCSLLDQGSFGKNPVLAGEQNKLIQPAKVTNVTKASTLSVRSLSNNITLSSKVIAKGKVQQHKSIGKVLMPHKFNEENQMIDKGTTKVGFSKRTTSLAKETASATMATCQKAKSSDKAAQSMGNIQKTSKQSVPQKDGSKILVGLKEKTNNRSRDKDTLNPARKVYFR